MKQSHRRFLIASLALLLPLLLAPAVLAAEAEQYIPPAWVAWLFVALALGIPVVAAIWYRRRRL